MSWLAVVAGCGRLGFDNPATDAAVVVDQDAPGDSATGPNRAFLTSTTYTGNAGAGGVAAFDAACQSRADAAGLGGRFVALISTSTRTWESPLMGSRGWVDLVGTPIADLPGHWTSGGMIFPLSRDELAMPVPLASAVRVGWGTTNTCTDWSSGMAADSGGAVLASEVFLRSYLATCNVPMRLACLEVGQQAPVTAPPQSGRIAFVSLPWMPGGGLAGADGQCASDASAAGLPGTYRAMLTTSASPSSTRYQLGLPPWRRVDGVRLAPTAAALFGGANLSTFLNMTAAGTTFSAIVNTWTGSGTDNCVNWTSGSGGALGAIGYPHTIFSVSFFANGGSDCGAARPLVCLQE